MRVAGNCGVQSSEDNVPNARKSGPLALRGANGYWKLYPV